MPRKKAAKKPARSRRPRGTGSSYPDTRRGGWAGKVPVGRDPQTGKTRYRYFRADTREEVERLMRTAQPPAPTVTLSEWCDRWLAALKARGGSKKTFRARIEVRIKPWLGHLPVTKVTAWDIEEAMSKWEGAASTVRGTLETLASVFRAAMRARLVTENPAALVRKPRAGAPPFDLFTRAELKLITLESLAAPELHLVAVLALTGMRAGEALALDPADFDARGLRVSITKTWTAAGIQDEPKSRQSRRTIEVHEALRPVLAAPRPRLHYQTLSDRWQSLLKRLHLSARGMHQLRHSFASYALADGTPVPDLAAHLGHTPAELLKTYAHKTGADMRGVAARVVGIP